MWVSYNRGRHLLSCAFCATEVSLRIKQEDTVRIGDWSRGYCDVLEPIQSLEWKIPSVSHRHRFWGHTSWVVTPFLFYLITQTLSDIGQWRPYGMEIWKMTVVSAMTITCNKQTTTTTRSRNNGSHQLTDQTHLFYQHDATIRQITK
jgi:hypothetical protein